MFQSGKRLALAALCALAAPLWAQECSSAIAGNDAMQFDKASITIPASCKSFTVKLTHSGKQPKAAMGHNWVLAKEADMQAIANDGIAAGPGKDYFKENDARVIAHTKMLGGGETDSVTFDVAALKAGEKYSYFCTFPGHFALMKGTLVLGP